MRAGDSYPVSEVVGTLLWVRICVGVNATRLYPVQERHSKAGGFLHFLQNGNGTDEFPIVQIWVQPLKRVLGSK
jgi:hypothetical protein